MSRRSTIGGILASASVLAIAGWIGASALPTQTSGSTSTSPTSSANADQSGQGSSTQSSGKTTGTNSTGTAAVDGTYTGDSVATRFGNVQVKVQVSGGRITDVTAVHLTDHDGRSVAISNRAAPILREKVLQAQSSAVTMVSGATYTSRAYLSSLQSALDQAGL
ncbi:FMN-binding protein [Microbacterium sp. E-13]|uniref:FMN-binding protein n=1 Tax=Microbacterium sp. E-13 TaxID=3404048 RepID=UPI003CF27B08